MHPLTAPDPLLSETGRRIVDLQKKNVTLREIARQVGCRHAQLQTLRDDPSATASRALVIQLETLHENVLCGMNKWGRMVQALVQHGWTYELIAHRAGVTTPYLRIKFGNPLRIPSNQVAKEIEGLYQRHVRQLIRD